MDRTVAGSVFRRLRIVIQLVVCACFCVHAARSFAEDSSCKACGFTDPSFNDASDIQGVIDYKAAIRQLLAAHKFEELDCIADAARASKSQLAGGRWKLNVLYWALEEPQGHATEEDWAAHLKTLNRWVSVRKKSITARVALASAYAPLVPGTHAARITATQLPKAGGNSSISGSSKPRPSWKKPPPSAPDVPTGT